MSGSLIAFCLWVIAAQVVALLPSRRNHWPQAYALIAAGIPIVGWVTYQNGALIGLLTMGAGISILRWPVHYALRRVRVLIGRGGPGSGSGSGS